MHRFSFKNLTLGMTMVALGIATGGCAGDEDDDAAATPSETHIEVEGSWEGDYGDETIDDASWTSGNGELEIVEYSNKERYAVVSGPDFNDPEKTVFSRYVWTKPTDDAFYYCTATYGCDSAEQTATGDDDDGNATCPAPIADETDLEGTGCGGSFPWSKLTKK